MIQTLRGVIHGNTIELEKDPGIEEGRQVEVTLRVKELPGPPPSWVPDNTETAAGMLADSWTEEDDRIFEQIYQDRKNERRPPFADLSE